MEILKCLRHGNYDFFAVVVSLRCLNSFEVNSLSISEIFR